MAQVMSWREAYIPSLMDSLQVQTFSIWKNAKFHKFTFYKMRQSPENLIMIDCLKVTDQSERVRSVRKINWCIKLLDKASIIFNTIQKPTF